MSWILMTTVICMLNMKMAEKNIYLVGRYRYMSYKIKNENGEINRGNYSNIAKVFEKAKKGEAIKVAFLGGSITQGCLSSTPETCYSYLVYDWFVKTFKESKIEYINAGIGGTTSQYCSRAPYGPLSNNTHWE